MINKEQIGKAYTKAIKANRKASAIARDAKYYSDAQRYANEVGNVASDVLLGGNIDWDDADDDLADAILEVLKRAHGDVKTVAAAVQRQINWDADIGLSPLSAEFDAARAAGLAEELMSGGFDLSDARLKLLNNLLHVVDETARINMEAQERAGLTTQIIRTYDDVGVHNRTEPCQWCLDRAGEWTSYREAYEAGVFERHPGCGCRIEYHVGKTHTIQEGQSRKWRAVQ